MNDIYDRRVYKKRLLKYGVNVVWNMRPWGEEAAREAAKYKSRVTELEAATEAVSAKVEEATAALAESDAERVRLSSERDLLERAARDMSALNAKLTQKLVDQNGAKTLARHGHGHGRSSTTTTTAAGADVSVDYGAVTPGRYSREAPSSPTSLLHPASPPGGWEKNLRRRKGRAEDGSGEGGGGGGGGGGGVRDSQASEIAAAAAAAAAGHPGAGTGRGGMDPAYTAAYWQGSLTFFSHHVHAVFKRPLTHVYYRSSPVSNTYSNQSIRLNNLTI